MKISRLTVRNFRSFYGEHAIALDTTDAAHVVVIHGENMRGKTSLLQAIRWGLYGEARDRDGQPIPILDPEEKEQLLSLDAMSEGEVLLEVTLEFEHEGVAYVLRRTAKASGDADSDEAFARDVELTRDGSPIATAMVEPTIQGILSRDVSRFFLFDGEMLAEYEHLLKSPDNEAETVKDSIEKILGLPALYAASDLSQEASKVEKKQNAQLKKLAKNNALLEDAARLENEVRGLRTELATLEKDLLKTRADADQAQLAVLQMGNVEKDIQQMNMLERQIDQDARRLSENREAIRRLLAKTWWLPVAGVIDQRVQQLDEQLAVAAEQQDKLRRIQELELTLKDKACSLCGARLADNQRDTLERDLTALKLENIEIEDVSLADMYRRRQTYEQFRAPEALTELELRERTIQEAQVAIGDCEAHIRGIRARISDRARGDMQEKTDRWQRVSKRSQDLQREVQETKDRLAETDARHVAAQRKLSSLPEADRSLGLEALAYRELAELFESVTDEFRERLRSTVGHDASTIFRELTTEVAYSGLEINERYGLSLLDSNGNPVPGRSAGAEQIVALSLIGGLNRAAVREGPVVMDTNFGRLDQGHRERVLRFLPELGKQVVILVHSGEISLDGAELSEVGLRVARRYDIRRISETRSEIVEIA